MCLDFFGSQDMCSKTFNEALANCSSISSQLHSALPQTLDCALAQLLLLWCMEPV